LSEVWPAPAEPLANERQTGPRRPKGTPGEGSERESMADRGGTAVTAQTDSTQQVLDEWALGSGHNTGTHRHAGTAPATSGWRDWWRGLQQLWSHDTPHTAHIHTYTHPSSSLFLWLSKCLRNGIAK